MVLPFIPAGSRVLDIGCDDGALLDRLPPFSLYVGVDSQEELIRQNQRRPGPDNVSFVRADFPDLDWPGPLFDRIVLAAVLEHLEGLEPSLVKLDSLLSEGGLLLITTPAPVSHHILKAGARAGLFARGSLDEHKRYYRKDDFTRLPGWRLERYRRFEFCLNQLLVLRKLSAQEPRP
jgi:2-polyprenyl-3-methyl-5-hydroxy-6-metoxy-1,4-benzoquinol methylase